MRLFIPVLVAVLLAAIACSKKEQPQQVKVEIDTLLIPQGISVSVDGVLEEGEWADAMAMEIEVNPGWMVTVFYKHDGTNLNVAYTGLRGDNAERYPEIIFDPQIERSELFGENQIWYHASYTDCYGKGEYDKYPGTPTKPDWQANNFPIRAPGIIEFSINLEKAGLGDKFGLLFSLLDKDGSRVYWPKSAYIQKPDTWGIGKLIDPR